jgi:protein tyrosine/serine phosphatase
MPAAPSALNPAETRVPRCGRRLRLARGIGLLFVGLFLVTGFEASRVFLGRNLHTVLPGRVYRCAQPSAGVLGSEVKAHGIRTVVNLRGCSFPLPWYLAESRATQALDVAQEDICFSAGRLPSPSELRRLVDVLDHAEYPLLLHCRRGADRTGMASTIAVLLSTAQDFTLARRQLGLRYGHVALGNTASLDQFFSLYADWLGAHGMEHSPAVFRRWLLHEYCPAECRAELAWCDHPHDVRHCKPFSVRIRACNTSDRTWRLRPGLNAGIHAGFIVWDACDRQIASGKAGLLDAEVPPGQSIAITGPLPALKKTGRYRLLVDMVNEQQGWFFQAGTEPLEEEFDVGE